MDQITIKRKGCPELKMDVEDSNQVSDGYHTFGQLYEHRIALWIALCQSIWAMSKAALSLGREDVVVSVWRSKRHSDGALCFGDGKWFVLGISKKKGQQMTYHLPIDQWDKCDFAETLENAPEFDGHTSEDVLERLKDL